MQSKHMKMPPGTWLWVGLAAGPFLLLSSVMILIEGMPVWKAVLLNLFIFSIAGAGIACGMGWAVIRSRDFLKSGIEFALKSDFKRARRAILMAVRADRGLLQVEDLHKLYEIIVASDDTAEAKSALRRAQDTMHRWPKTKLSAIFLTPEFRVAVITIVAAIFLLRLLSLK